MTTRYRGELLTCASPANYNCARIKTPDGKGFLDWRPGSGRTVEIFDIHVDNSVRRTGIGRALVYNLLDKRLSRHDVKMVYAITRADNRIAQLFYEELRFRLIANLFDFYRDTPNLEGTVDAVMYGRDMGAHA